MKKKLEPTAFDLAEELVAFGDATWCEAEDGTKELIFLAKRRFPLLVLDLLFRAGVAWGDEQGHKVPGWQNAVEKIAREGELLAQIGGLKLLCEVQGRACDYLECDPKGMLEKRDLAGAIGACWERIPVWTAAMPLFDPQRLCVPMRPVMDHIYASAKSQVLNR